MVNELQRQARQSLWVIVSEIGWWLQVAKNCYKWYGCQYLHITLALLKGLAVRLRLQDQVCCCAVGSGMLLSCWIRCVAVLLDQVCCCPVVSKFDLCLHFPMCFPLIPSPVQVWWPIPLWRTVRSAVMRSCSVLLQITNFFFLLLFLEWPTRRTVWCKIRWSQRGELSGSCRSHIVLCWY